MPLKPRTIIVRAFASALLALLTSTAGECFFNMPVFPMAEEYGNVMISRTSEKNGMKPVSFSHWVHRRKFTCRVCHFELEFAMQQNRTKITETEIRAGHYCGACHDGVNLFGTKKKDECVFCHNGDPAISSNWFDDTAIYPQSIYGNQIDWSEAWRQNHIDPKRHLTIEPFDKINYAETLVIEADWKLVPPAIFPHGEHIKWLDCNDCHPHLFNIRKKFTKGFKMTTTIKGQFCGTCHMTVAFPLTDCKRCHPTMKVCPIYPPPLRRFQPEGKSHKGE